MNSFLKILERYHFHILFVIFEIVALIFIIRHNSYHGSIVYSVGFGVTNSFEKHASGVTSYLSLKRVNEELARENVALRNRLDQFEQDSALRSDYIYRPARVIYSSYNKTKNYLMIDRGRIDGVSSDMGVCAGDNVLGITLRSSDRYTLVLPLINTNLSISGMIKKNGYYGSLKWDGLDYRYTYLFDIPVHVDVAVGDTIVTSGFSSIFPEGKLLGFVESVEGETTNFKNIRVRLAADFKHVDDVNVVQNENSEELREFEKDFADE